MLYIRSSGYYYTLLQILQKDVRLGNRPIRFANKVTLRCVPQYRLLTVVAKLVNSWHPGHKSKKYKGVSDTICVGTRRRNMARQAYPRVDNADVSTKRTLGLMVRRSRGRGYIRRCSDARMDDAAR